MGRSSLECGRRETTEQFGKAVAKAAARRMEYPYPESDEGADLNRSSRDLRISTGRGARLGFSRSRRPVENGEGDCVKIPESIILRADEVIQ